MFLKKIKLLFEEGLSLMCEKSHRKRDVQVSDTTKAK